MFPAFDNWRAAARFSALLLALLLLPVINLKLGLPPREAVYNGLRLAGGPYVKTRQEEVGHTGHNDVGFGGSSILHVGGNGEGNEAPFAGRFRPEGKGRLFRFGFQGYDNQFLKARGLLEHRKVK